MKKRFDLTAQTVVFKNGYWLPFYEVEEPKSGIRICFCFDIKFDKHGLVEYCIISVLTHSLEWIICHELAGERIYTYDIEEKIETILYNATNLGWITGEASFSRYLDKDEFISLLPKNFVHGEGEDVDIEWGKLDWFRKAKYDIGQRCLPYVEELLNKAADYCIKEYWR